MLQAHINLGVFLHDLGRLVEAEAKKLHTSAEIKPDYTEAHSNLGNTLRLLGRLDEAETSYQRRLKSIRSIQAYSNLGVFLQDLAG